jgi:hypothetical protein
MSFIKGGDGVAITQVRRGQKNTTVITPLHIVAQPAGRSGFLDNFCGSEKNVNDRSSWELKAEAISEH